MPDICSYISVTSNWKVELKRRSNHCCCSCLTRRHVLSSFQSGKGVRHHFDWDGFCMSKSIQYVSPSVYFVCAAVCLEQIFSPIQWLSDPLMRFVREQQWNTLYLFTMGLRTHYLYRPIIHVAHYVNDWVCYGYKTILVFLLRSSFVVYGYKFRVVSMVAPIFDGSVCSLLLWDLQSSVGITRGKISTP